MKNNFHASPNLTNPNLSKIQEMVNEEELIEEEIAKAIELSPDNPRNYERLFGATEVHRQKGFTKSF